MKPLQYRLDWLEDLIREGPGVDILQGPSVDAYCEACEIQADVQNFGPNKCRTLGADLRRLHADGIVNRGRIGLKDGSWYPGLPKWVWSYNMTPEQKVQSARNAAVRKRKASL